MKSIDWKRWIPKAALWGAGAAVIGAGAWALSSGRCPFAVCAGEVVPAASESNSVEKGDKMEWMTNFKAAQELAKKENKILFLSFSGSDWCSWCMKLDAEVLDTPEFQAWVKRNAVPVKLDFPRKAVLSEALRAQNETLARYYGVEGFPTVVLAGTDGREIARTGYRNGGAAAYVKHLEEIQGQGKGK